ncbi:MAG: Nif3-like dinuclear metal center hexameric protein [Archaeoglobus sp.]|nr:Nif3-like dinuclear metal center hexameric protein [Archaeoglobus sp.]
MRLEEVVSFLDDYLDIKSFKDSSSNGLQIEGRREVGKVGFAVDACIESFEKAKELDLDLLIVHHGLIWGGFRNVRGLFYRRLKFLITSGISLYVAHLPLDAHPEVGNNVQILKKLGADFESFFAEYEGKEIGALGSLQIGMDMLEKEVGEKLNTKVRSLRFGKEELQKISVVSGSGAFAIEEASEISDCLITGEYKHEAYHAAKELGFNVIFAGHYATETLGLKALMHSVENMGLETFFIEIPNPDFPDY